MMKLLERLDFNNTVVEILPSGYHTQVRRISSNGSDSVVKIIRKKVFADLSVAEELAQDIRAYHALLHQAGIRVPEISHIEMPLSISGNDSGNDLVLIAPFAGYDAERRLLAGELSIPEVLDGVLEGLNPLLTAHQDCQLEVGIDPKPANFVSNNGNLFSYVDWMPPRYTRNGVTLVEFERPKSEAGFQLAFFRSFDVRGLLLLLQSQLSKLNPRSRRQIKARILDYARSLGQIVADYLEALPSETVFSAATDSAIATIEQFRPQQMYLLREVACELVFRRLADEPLLAKVFHLTHFYDDLPEEELFHEAQQLVVEVFKRRSA